MGRFYKTAKPTFVDDVIYQAPYELMLGALQAQDANFEELQKPLEGTEALYEGLEYHDKDSQIYQDLIKKTSEDILDLTDKIYSDKANAAQYTRQINKLRKDLEYSVKAGDFHQMDRNAKRRNKLVNQIQENPNYTDKQKESAIKQIDFEYGTIKGENNTFSDDFHIYEKLDEEQFIKDKKAEMTANSIKTTENRTDGRYFTTESGEKRFIKEEDIKKMFLNSTGVDKWEKALLQRLDWEVSRGELQIEDEKDVHGNVIKEGRNTIFQKAKDKFMFDTINSLKFEQKSDSTLLSTDNTNHQDQMRAMAWGRYKKEMEELEETGKVIIERDRIPVPDTNLTEEDEENKKYNESSEKIKTKIREKLKASGKFTKKVENTGMGPHLQPDGTIVVDEEALNQAVEEENNRIRKTLALPLQERKDYTKELIQTYGKNEVTNLLNFEANKTEEYNSETMTSAEKKTFKNQTYATIPSDFVGQVTMPDGTVKNMTRNEFEKTAETLIPTKKTVETPITIKGEEFEGGEAGKVYAAYEASNGQILPIKTKDTKEPVLESNYNNNKIYASNQKQGIKKTKEIVGVVQPFDIRKMDVSTTSKIKYVNPLQTTKKDEKLNIHVQTSEGPMIWRIKKPIDNTFIQNK